MSSLCILVLNKSYGFYRLADVSDDFEPIPLAFGGDHVGWPWCVKLQNGNHGVGGDTQRWRVEEGVRWGMAVLFSSCIHQGSLRLRGTQRTLFSLFAIAVLFYSQKIGRKRRREELDVREGRGHATCTGQSKRSICRFSLVNNICWRVRSKGVDRDHSWISHTRGSISDTEK